MGKGVANQQLRRKYADKGQKNIDPIVQGDGRRNSLFYPEQKKNEEF